MRSPRLLGPVALGFLYTLLSYSSSPAHAYQVVSVPSPNIDLSGLGRVALTGNFDSLALYTYQGQSADTFSTNGSQALFAQLPNGAFQNLATADAAIRTLCPFYRKSGDLLGVIVGGNFTSLGGVEAQGIALFNTSNNQVVPLPGLNGSVNALYCDQQTDSVYVGGDFHGGNTTNAIAWVGTAGWTVMPFQGFNAPVNTIAKAPNDHIIWGGSFTGLGNMSTPTAENEQIINLLAANLSTTGTTATDGFADPKNILCKTNGQDGPSNTWLLQDHTPGAWTAAFDFGFQPTKLRLWNTHQDGRGTKTWRFSNNPNSILRFTFQDPDNNNQNSTCDQTCPLSNNPNVKFQDFYFVNTIGMNGFSIDISDWWGDGGGLDGIELFENDIYAYAVTDFNEPQCDTSSSRSGSTTTGLWQPTPSGNSVANYLTANLTGPGVNSSSASVTFYPDIKQAGTYMVTIYTPGCQQDDSCSQRGQANITGAFTRTAAAKPLQSTIYQTNEFDKYDQLYTGTVDTSSDSFRPSITLSPLENQNDSISLTALRVRFQLLDPASMGLNGLYDYDPSNFSANTDFKDSKIDMVGINLDEGADVRSIISFQSSTYVAGNFSSQNASNILAMDSNNNSVTLPGGGLNGQVMTMNQYENFIFVGGTFNDTNTTHTDGLQNVAQFDTTTNTWSALGGGVNGKVNSIVQLMLNVTPNVPESCITLNGDFTQVLADGPQPAFAVLGLAVWVPERKGWLSNLKVQMQAISGQLTFAANLSNDTPLLAGTIASQGLSFSDSAEMTAADGMPALQSSGLGIQADASQPNFQKRSEGGTSANSTGVVTGIYDTTGGRNLTIFGGHFDASGSDGTNLTNLVIIDNAKNQTTGLPSSIDANSTFISLSTNGDTLLAGGVVTGDADGSPINGLVVWDMAKSAFNSSLPPALGGDVVSVNAISTKPNSADVYVAGLFDSAGQLGCPSVCVYTGGQWSRPGKNLGGGNVTATMWQGDNTLIAVGIGLEVDNQQTNVAAYDTNGQKWSVPNGASSIPGPVYALAPASSDGSSYWIGGQDSSANPFVMLFKNNNFQAAPALGAQSFIRGLSVLSLTQAHDSNDFIDPSLALLVTGSLILQNFGNCSGVLFNGTGYTPFLLSNEGNSPGTVSVVVTEQTQPFNTGGSHLAVGFVVLIGLAIALAIIGLLVALGLLVERRRRRAEGYRPAPQNYFEKTANMGRIPPERLFGNLNTPTAPRV